MVTAQRQYVEPIAPDQSRIAPQPFEAAIAEIEAAVGLACQAQTEGSERIAAGVHAALDYATANPVAARALTVESRAGTADEASAYVAMIARFAGLLSGGTAEQGRLPASSDEALVRAIAMIVGSHVRAGTTDCLAELAPDLVFLALLPHVGFAAASRSARLD